MKAVRLLQILVALAAVAYLALLHDMNDVNVVLPFFISLPPAVVIVIALVLGWLLAWLPATIRAMRRRRELRRLRQRVAELEQNGAPHALEEPVTPVIPDRDPAPVEAQEPYSEHENL